MQRLKSKPIMIVIGVGLVLVILGGLGGLRPVTTVLGYATSPIRGGFRGIGSGLAGLTSNVTGISHLQADNAKLHDQLSALKQQASQDTEIRHQNDILRRQLEIGGPVTQHLVAADVIGYQPDNFRQFLTIGRGSNDGIKVGQAVESAGVLVGTIASVSKSTATVFLVTDPNFKVSGVDQSTRADGTVEGQLGTGLVMDKIAQNATVTPGDTVITSGLGGDLPKGIIIGQIQSVSNQGDNQVFQTAQLNTSVQVSKLELVFVVTGS